MVHTDTDCGVDSDKVKMVDGSDQDIVPGSDKEYYGLLAYYNDTTKKGRVQLHEYGLVDESAQQMFLCEKETDWTCPEGYIMFREECYKMFEEQVTSAEAELRCREEGAKVLELSSLSTLSFVSAWLADQDYSPTGVWLGYQRHTSTTNSSQNMEYLAFDGSSQFDVSKFSLAGSDVADLDCLVLENNQGSYSSFEQLSCHDTAQYVCQKEQTVTYFKADVIQDPQFVLPLDKTSGYDIVPKVGTNNNQSLVAITEQSTPSRLVGSADFLRNYDSHIETSSSISPSVKFGVTILVWVFIAEEVEPSKKIFIFDGAQETDDKSLQFFIENISSKILLGAQVCKGDSSCSTYYSQNDLSLSLYRWHFVGFTFSVDDMRGTFIINDTFGYSESAGKNAEASYFEYDTQAWLHTGALKGSIMIGSEKGASSGFGGKLSCLQLHEMFFTPSQVKHVKKCPVPGEHERYSDCPDGFHLYKESCYKVSKEESEFSDAELHCSSEPDSPYLMRLAFPSDYRTQEYLSNLINTTRYNVSQVWLGLDMRSDVSQPATAWTRSDGVQVDEILWADGQPENIGEQQCVFIDSTKEG